MDKNTWQQFLGQDSKGIRITSFYQSKKENNDEIKQVYGRAGEDTIRTSSTYQPSIADKSTQGSKQNRGSSLMNVSGSQSQLYWSL